MIPTWCVGMCFKDKVSTRKALHSDAGCSLTGFGNGGWVSFQGGGCKIDGDNLENQCLSRLYFHFFLQLKRIAGCLPILLPPSARMSFPWWAAVPWQWPSRPELCGFICLPLAGTVTTGLWLTNYGGAMHPNCLPRALCKLGNHNSFKYNSVREINNYIEWGKLLKWLF